MFIKCYYDYTNGTTDEFYMNIRDVKFIKENADDGTAILQDQHGEPFTTKIPVDRVLRNVEYIV